MRFKPLITTSAALWLSVLTLSAPAALAQDAAAGAQCHHALSLIGEPKMGADFKHFDWVNPDAPKGGIIRQYADGTFDTLNQFADKGVKAAGISLIYDSLMTGSPDEPSTSYGLIAECVSYPDDFSSATFKLRPEARFHDGSPITADDVIFSFEQMKKISAAYAFYWKNVVKAEKTGEHQVTFTFDSTGNRELPLIISELSVLPKVYWTANGADGQPRDLAKTTVEPPLGNGAYKIKSFEIGRSIVYERVADYWAKDLPVMKGQWNFDTLQYTYYRDRTPAFEAFKTGQIDVWGENVASDWATKYDFDAVKKALVKKEAIPIERVAPMQAFIFNTRRKKFEDPRVRKALWLLLDFEEANKKLFYDLYVRVGSFFENSELKAAGLPEGRELEILNEVKDQVPPEVFTTEWKNPVNAAPGDFRKHQQQAMKLLNEAGWKIGQDRVLRNPAGEPMEIELLLAGPTFERIALHYRAGVEPLGIKLTPRVVDDAQYKLREDKRDFDMVIDGFAQSLSPGNEQRQYWGSAAADTEASRNTIGIKNPAIDKIIDRIVFAKDRADLVAATKALDRVLLWNFYVVPHWHYPYERLAWWDKFSRPAKTPSQTSAMMQIWWIDPEKSAALDTAKAK